MDRTSVSAMPLLMLFDLVSGSVGGFIIVLMYGLSHCGPAT